MFGKGNFSGQFRRLPTVSIGGASKSESKDELIRRAQLDRRQREVREVYMAGYSYKKFLSFPVPSLLLVTGQKQP